MIWPLSFRWWYRDLRERQYRKNFLGKMGTELGCKRCKPKHGRNAVEAGDILGGKSLAALDTGCHLVWPVWGGVKWVVRNPARWWARSGDSPCVRASAPPSIPTPRNRRGRIFLSGPAFHRYPAEQCWTFVSPCQWWRRSTRDILQGSEIAQSFAFFSNTGVKTASLAKSRRKY